VKVAHPGVHLGYRKGYNNDDIQHDAITSSLPLTTTAPEPYQSNMVASMGRGVPTASQVLFSVAVLPDTAPAKPNAPSVIGTLDPKLAGKPLVRYNVMFVIPAPAKQISLTKAADGTGKFSLDFDIAAYDVYGKRITGLSQTVSSASLTEAKFRQMTQKPYHMAQQIDLPPGEIFLRVGVLDGVSNKVGTLEIPLIVKKPTAGAADSSGGNVGK